jgi:tRNA threonylcarbamoyladenosine biosynthesis protein TsaE
LSATLTLELSNLTETEAFGIRLASHLFPGCVIGLVGPLGAGKTHLVRAIAVGLGLRQPAAVSSPTFVLIQEYDASLPVYHFDAYRLRGEDEFDDLGAQEYFRGDGVCLVEWADRVPRSMPVERLEVRFVVTGQSTRRLELTAIGDRYASVLDRIGAQGPLSRL